VNSPIKPPTTTNKDGTPKEVASHRKPSLSQSINSPGNYGLASPTSTRPRNARRETSEAYPFPPSPSGNSRFSRDESSAATPPPALLRRRTDMKESPAGTGTEERDKERATNTEALPFTALKRSVTGGLGGASPSTWTPTQGAAFGAMGSFGNFALGTGAGQPTAVADKRPGFGSMRGESRFKGLMGKGSSEDNRREVKEKASMGSLGKAQGSEHDKGNSSWMETRFNRPTSESTDPFPDEDLPTGSAALNGALDASPPAQRGFAGFAHASGHDDAGFSAFGMTSDTIGDAVHQTPHRNEGGHEQMSPTDTNPYQSPEHDKIDTDEVDTDGSDVQRAHLPGLGGFGNNQGGLPGLGGFGGIGRVPGAFEIAASDRSQTSSVGPGGRGFPSLSGLGGLPGLGGPSAWGGAQGGMGTPTRDRSGFGGTFAEGLFGSMAELQSPVLAGLGSGGFGAAPGTGLGGTIGRGSKMGSLFPSGMQEQMRAAEQGRQVGDEMAFESFDRQQPGFGSFGRSAFGPNALSAGSARESDSPFRPGRGLFDELLANRNEGQTPIGEPIGHGQHSGNGPTPNLSAQPSQEPLGMHRTSQPQLNRQPSLVASPGSANPPAAQIRQMVMPDRMRWIYKDPQGNTQGPWSGLEMHDWYKAGFFTPELLIKRLEDPEFEPLAQLIRRIGNSREPFLVPQIGVPHDPPAGQGRGIQGPAAPGAQPPFASSFPSFGTTLTAEQQNALERRKQEEQYLMARQKEHLAQQQLLIKQMHVSGQPHGILPPLNHHSSAHSLHSQPSFGSITSPSGYQPSPTQGPMSGGQPVPGFFDNSFRSAPSGAMGPMVSAGEMLSNIREDEMPGMMERLNLARGGQQGPSSFGQNQPHDVHAQQVAAMLNDRARLEREQAEHDARQQGYGQEEFEGQQTADRFQHFRNLRAQAEHELQQSGPSREEREQAAEESVQSQIEQAQRDHLRATDIVSTAEPQSLTQQVQAAASAKQAVAQQTTWTKVDMSTMEPLQRPPQSSSPMPAPIAQRKQNLVETLAEESRSRTQSPSVETPSASVAPWAKESVEAPKAQSLKEIQEAEAKRAAKHEELAAAQRRATFERELAVAQAAVNSTPAPGLPPGASWASTQSPAGSAASGPSVWGAKTVSKPSSKTLQQIQKEEEAKKQRAAAAAAVSVGNSVAVSTPQLSSGKRYADLASKSASPAPTLGGSAWSTVGAGGKVKAMPPLPPSSAVRAASGTVPTSPAKPSITARSSTITSAQMAKMSKTDALDEFKKWASGELLRGQLSKEVSGMFEGSFSYPYIRY
jgi:PERQ amino acid-rich with GYF domain-containing protein